MSKKKEKTIFDYTSSKDMKKWKKLGVKKNARHMMMVVKEMNIDILKEHKKKLI